MTHPEWVKPCGIQKLGYSSWIHGSHSLDLDIAKITRKCAQQWCNEVDEHAVLSTSGKLHATDTRSTEELW
jgi:hypothetical protein